MIHLQKQSNAQTEPEEFRIILLHRTKDLTQGLPVFLSNAVAVILKHLSVTTSSRTKAVVAVMPAAAVQTAGSMRASRVPMEPTRRADALWHASSEAAIMIFPHAGIG